MDKNSNVPEIRFKGFDAEWKQRKLGDLYTERNECGNDSLQFLSVTIHSGVSDGELDSDQNGKNVRRSEDKSMYKHVYSGDLVFNMMRAWQGAIGVARSEGMISPAYISAIPNAEVYPPFMNYLMRRKESINQINTLSYGLTDFRKRLYWDSFVKVSCQLPIVSEQKQITDLFEQLDNLIAFQKRKVERLKNAKKAMLTKLFPKEGERVPEVRFKGFTGNWEQRKLGDCFEERTERRQSETDELLSVTMSDGVVRQSHSDRKNIASADTSNYKMVYEGDLAYNSMRMWQGAEGASEYYGIVSPAYTVVKPFAEIKSEFFARLFKRDDILRIFRGYSQGLTSDTWNLKFPAFSKINVFVPTVDEQIAIMSMFKSIDTLITLHQRKVEKLIDCKKAFLNKMFGGES